MSDSNIIDKNIANLHLEKYLTFIDNSDTKEVVKILSNDSSAIQDIINMIDLILADGKIDIADAPLLIGLTKKIVSLRTKDLELKKNLSIDHFLDIIKLIFIIFAKEGILNIKNTDEFITDITNLISTIKTGENIVKSIPNLSCTDFSFFSCKSKK